MIDNGSYTIEVGTTNKLMITPKLVQTVIEDAITMGWQQAELGPPVQLSLKNGTLEVRRGLCK